jgi:hypothetical protein
MGSRINPVGRLALALLALIAFVAILWMNVPGDKATVPQLTTTSVSEVTESPTGMVTPDVRPDAALLIEGSLMFMPAGILFLLVKRGSHLILP